MRIGVYGGSFNPPHTGHVLAARELQAALSLDRLLIVPAASPPHKTLSPGSPGPMERLELCRTAFAGLPGVELCDLELRRAGKSYTVDTLRELTAAQPEDELFFIMGTDMFLSFSTWYQPEQIAQMATLAIMRREEDEALRAAVSAEAERLERSMGARVVQVENRCEEISSTTVRRLLAFGAPAHLTPQTEELILQRGWYLTGGSLRDLPEDELEALSLSLHDPKRRPHVLGTAQTAVHLAARYGADARLARRAGLLHDITKALGAKEQLHLCEKYAMMLTKSQRENPKLLHALTGAAVAAHVFGEPEAVVSAIRWHTTGRPDMERLEKILYIADYVEPSRSFPGVDALRELVEQDLDAAVTLGLERTVAHLHRQGSAVDPDSLAALEYFRSSPL